MFSPSDDAALSRKNIASPMDSTSEVIRENLSKALEYGKKAIHIGWIPFVIYMGKLLASSRVVHQISTANLYTRLPTKRFYI